MKFIGRHTVKIATYTSDVEPQVVPAPETADIVRFSVSRGVGRSLQMYEFHKNPPNWGSSVPGYKWEPYRRASGPLGWLVEKVEA